MTEEEKKPVSKPVYKPTIKAVKVKNIRDSDAPVFSDIDKKMFYPTEFGRLSPELAKKFMKAGYVEADI